MSFLKITIIALLQLKISNIKFPVIIHIVSSAVFLKTANQLLIFFLIGIFHFKILDFFCN